MKQAILYSVPGCAKCSDLAKWLTTHQVDFTIKNLMNPAVLADLMIDGYFGRAAPILQVGETFLVPEEMFAGEDLMEEKVKKALEEA